MDSEKSLMEWLSLPLLILILVTPLRFALEVVGLSTQITRFFSSTAFVFLLAACLGMGMAGRVMKPVPRLLAVGFVLGYLNGFMTLIATLLSTYASIETHYRHHSLNMSDAQHVFITHLIKLPLYTSLGACVATSLAFYVALKIKQMRKQPRSSEGLS